MKPIDNFQPHNGGSPFKQLPAGAYVARIINAMEDGRQLSIKVEIIEGEYAGYYQQNYDAQSQGKYPAKYKGYLRLFIPQGNGSKMDQVSKDQLEKAIKKIQDSNPGYTWDWNERGLSGRLVGINVRNTSWNGNEYTEIGCFESVQDVRQGRARKLPDRKRQEQDAQPAANNGYTNVTPDDIPW